MVVRNPEPIEGIQFVTNSKGEQTAVLLDLRLYGAIWEDIYDIILTHQRAQEPRETLADVRQLLIKEGKLDG
ncbi:MAG: hypothetical protein OT477_12020 [Chloroflexi bacterium]|nr:hypothetical protein [Chloroflexota bacterium]